MPQYITQADIDAYGTDLLDMTQRAAIQATAPHLQHLQQQNAALEHQLAYERRQRLDLAVEAAIPNFREIDADPAWHRWLLGIDPLNGRIRQELLNEAIAQGNLSRVKAFFDGFRREHGADHRGHHGSGRP